MSASLGAQTFDPLDHSYVSTWNDDTDCCGQREHLETELWIWFGGKYNLQARNNSFIGNIIQAAGHDADAHSLQPVPSAKSVRGPGIGHKHQILKSVHVSMNGYISVVCELRLNGHLLGEKRRSFQHEGAWVGNGERAHGQAMGREGGHLHI